MSNGTWTVAEAKAKLLRITEPHDSRAGCWRHCYGDKIICHAVTQGSISWVIDQARLSGPRIITRNGRTASVILPPEERERKTKRAGNLAEFLASSLLRGSELKLKRVRDRPRKFDQ